MSDKPEIPHGLLAQLERVRVEIERLAGMSVEGISSVQCWEVEDAVIVCINGLRAIGNRIRREASKCTLTDVEVGE